MDRLPLRLLPTVCFSLLALTLMSACGLTEPVEGEGDIATEDQESGFIDSPQIPALETSPTATPTSAPALTPTPTGSPTLKLVGGDQQTAQAGSPLSRALEIVAIDALGKPAASEQIEFSIVQGTGILARTTIFTDAVGSASVNLELGGSLDEVIVAAEWLPNPNQDPERKVEFHAFVLPAEPSTVQFLSGTGQCTVENFTYPNPMTAGLFDRFGNAVPNRQVTATVSNGSISGSASAGFVSDSGGKVTFSVTSGAAPYNDPNGAEVGVTITVDGTAIRATTKLKTTDSLMFVSTFPQTIQAMRPTPYIYPNYIIPVQALGSCSNPWVGTAVKFYINGQHDLSTTTDSTGTATDNVTGRLANPDWNDNTIEARLVLLGGNYRSLVFTILQY